MTCSKIGNECPNQVVSDDKLIFAIMPFNGSTNVYDTIQQSIENVGKGFKCFRADEIPTISPIWCENICANIRKAKYLIVDITDLNPNVIYELGFSHALENTKAIIISQNFEGAPFDIKELGKIEYSKDYLPNLRKKLEETINNLEKKKCNPTKSKEEIIADLKLRLRNEEERLIKIKDQLRLEEERSSKLKEQLIKEEEQEKILIKKIKVVHSINVKEGENEFEVIISELNSHVRYNRNS